MVTCEICQIGYGECYAVCPKCGQFETPKAARLEFLTADAGNQLRIGRAVNEVFEDLVANGVEHGDARFLINKHLTTIVSKRRREGMKLAVLGLVITPLGLGFMIAAFVANFLPYLTFFAGWVTFVFGCRTCFSGFAGILGDRSENDVLPEYPPGK